MPNDDHPPFTPDSLNVDRNLEEPTQTPLENVASTPFFELFDGLLRRRESFFETIFAGREVVALIRWCLFATAALAGLYGLTMGASSMAVSGWQTGLLQALSSGIKVPALYFISLIVCFPVLYFVVVLMGSRLSFSQTLALILLALTMNAVLLAGCAPIALFFVFTGSDYHFIKLLHFVFFAFSGAWAMTSLWQGLVRMCERSSLYPRQAVKILQVWILVFGFVGTQTAWSLRPFVGHPMKPFEWFRSEQASNFYMSVWSSVSKLGTESISNL